MTVRAPDRSPLPGSRPAVQEDGPAGLPLTAAQAELWAEQARDPGGAALNTAAYREIHGPLDPVLFAEALHRTVGEADALRVRITDTPHGPRQQPIAVEPPGHGFPLCAADLRGQGDVGDATATALAWMHADLDRAIDLAEGPPFRYGLFRVGDRRWLWYRRVHRAVLDGYGRTLVDHRVAEVYTALSAGEEPEPSPFGRLACLVAEDTGYRNSAAYDRDRAYWRSRLGDLAGAGETTTGGDAAHAPTRPTCHIVHVDPDTTTRLRELAASVRGSWTGLLLAAHALHLSRTTHREDVVLRLPLTGRTSPAALRVPGTVRNAVPLRLTVTSDTTFAELTRQADLGIREARRHQRHRGADIRRELGLPAGHPALSGPLVDVVPAGEPVAFAGARSTLHPLATGAGGGTTTVTLRDTADGGLRIDWETAPGSRSDGDGADSQAADGSRHFADLLVRLSGRDPHLPLDTLSPAHDEEHERVLRECNDTAVTVPPTTAIGPFEARAARTPGATALVADGECLSYAELNARANRLARHLAALGLRPGRFAGVDLPRSTAQVVGLLAVLKTGGAWLFPVPGRPDEEPAPVCVLAATSARAERLAAGRAVPVGLDDPALPHRLAGYPATDPGRPLTPRHSAYATRVPSGPCAGRTVVVPHSALDNRLRWLQGRYELAAGDRVLLTGPPSADTWAEELLWPLREGAALVLADDGEPAASTARRIREHGVTVARFASEALDPFLRTPGAADCATLLHVLTTEEPPGPATVGRFRSTLPHAALHHHYGPAEAAGTAHHTCEPGGSAPTEALRPVWNTRLHILDPALRPCPPGVPGELCVAGAQLATGYAGRPSATAVRFPADPYGPPGTRMYRTGQWARRRADGGVELLGDRPTAGRP
ncbi:AMP-binding protein [Streptomyces sp. I05A-00742]|uniref:AMP-binding protein n=1 Tax=Streptomyces sp. I05A-00742 TaxID=2732853 RepID=UPI001BB2AC1C|nr:AMP-binding protein [Streptomyces sp. I05A-00742]